MLHYGIAGPPGGRHYENSPKYRRGRVMAGGNWGKDWENRQRAPFVAVRALLFSMGYQIAGTTNERSQRGKWDVAMRYNWVPFEVTKAGVSRTRWVRANPGAKMEVSDGSRVPRDRVFHYALARLKYKQERAE